MFTIKNKCNENLFELPGEGYSNGHQCHNFKDFNEKTLSLKITLYMYVLQIQVM